MTKLNEMQSILLSNAAQRESGSLYPLPKTITAGSRATKATTSLLKAGFAKEREVSDALSGYRQDSDISVGLFVTTAGLAAIAITEGGQSDTACIAPESASGTPLKQASKRDTVITLPSREAGATLGELIAATGWLPHTTRAALTGLRKAGHSIHRGKRDDQTCYTIPARVIA